MREFKINLADGVGWEVFSSDVRSFDSIPNDKFLDISKLKAFADDKINLS